MLPLIKIEIPGQVYHKSIIIGKLYAIIVLIYGDIEDKRKIPRFL